MVEQLLPDEQRTGLVIKAQSGFFTVQTGDGPVVSRVRGSLLQERRRVLHARIVEVLETFGDDQSEQVERLAYHAFRGEVWDKALMYFRQAGQKALGNSANQEAVSRF